MFTGIIQDVGTLNQLSNGLYVVTTNLNLSNCKEGSSICCNGVCLTAKNIKKINNNNYCFEVNIGEETILRTNLGKKISKNKKVNLERSLRIGEEISGHFVYGHVDATSSIKDILKFNNSWEYHFEKNFSLNNKFVVEKGSISINGISLTIANVEKNSFKISVIEHTYNNTNLKYLNLGDHVNIEFDYLARFIMKND